MTRRRHVAHSRLCLVAALAGLGCGATDRATADHDRPPEPALATVVTNVCPEFSWWLLLPKRLRLGETTEVIVNVTDPDAPAAPLEFEWASAAGAFSEPTGVEGLEELVLAQTAYTCEASGQQRLTLSARDESDCTSTLDLDVLCTDDEP
jgi:hypothetical protein